jgi:hypothetical protein
VEERYKTGLYIYIIIKGFYMFRALLARPQEMMHKLHLVYCVHVMSVSCTRIEAARSIPSATCVTPPEDEQITFEMCRGP